MSKSKKEETAEIKQVEDLVKVTYIKDGVQAKKGETIQVTKEYAEALRENGWIK